ncbi:hypothetical protein Bca52824_096091 [Brassica carinata]|uniref:Uncharacterized protein n=1 Tax=Brassica carinata TaxID=52824 RepID=A0A8X7NZ43_BRACI|nr:hypothetical protein Bca52824_096091 [Brassica carinata]
MSLTTKQCLHIVFSVCGSSLRDACFYVLVYFQVAPKLAGVAVAAAAYAGKYGIEAWQAFKARPPRPKLRKFYEGGFQAAMTRREAALILGVRFVSLFL